MRMLGAKPPLAWVRNEQGLTVTLPPQQPCRHTYVVKITSEPR